jgi:site-specific DNA recombinase
VLYVRVSALMGREVGAQDFHSPGMQVDAMRRTISTAGLREVAVVEDIDVSGQTFSREGLDTIRAMIEKRQVDAVAVYDLSRLGRNVLESLTFIGWLRDRGVTIISAREHIDGTSQGQFMLGQYLLLAELYGNQIGEKWSEVIERRARAGRHHGVVPQGYLRHDDGTLAVDTKLGPAVTAVFTEYAAGAFVADIARAFGAARNRPVRRNVVKAMLANPTYLGRVVVRVRGGARVEVPGAHPPLVDQNTWDRVQERLARDRVTPARRLAAKYGLTGLVWCAHCDGAMQVWWSNESGGVRRMVCSRRAQVGLEGCTGPGTPRYTDIEEAVLTEVVAYAARLRGNPAARAARKARTTRAGHDAAGLQKRLTTVREAMTRITTRWGQHQMSDAVYEASMADLAGQESTLQEQLARARSVASTVPDPGRVVRLVDLLVELWPNLTEPERNRALRDVVARVRVRRAERWREPVADRLDIEMR